jgi:hypothetical protein
VKFELVLCDYLTFLNNLQFHFFLNFRIKEPLVLVFLKKNQNYKSTKFGYFKNIKELAIRKVGF